EDRGGIARRRHRLVEDHGRVVDEGSRNRDPLLLAARELVGVVGCAVAEADRGEPFASLGQEIEGSCATRHGQSRSRPEGVARDVPVPASPTTTASPSLRSPRITSVAVPSVMPSVTAIGCGSPSASSRQTRPPTPALPSALPPEAPRAGGEPLDLASARAPAGRKRSAAFGTFRTFAFSPTISLTFAVMPGSSRPPRLSVAMTTV